MIKVEHVDTFNFENAIRGMRNPLNSWDKSDSDYESANMCESEFVVGDNDLDLMRRLYKGGSEHRKYLRQIFVSMDITAPLYWWKEFDTYKVGTVSNSCSTMHKIMSKEFTLDDFSHEHIGKGMVTTVYDECLENIINTLNEARANYLCCQKHKQLVDGELKKTSGKEWWWQVIQLLPSSYNQKRTITMNYENVVTIIKQRAGHKLDEWNDFIKILKELPYINEIIENIE